jgi:hypothetical protein
MIGSNPGRGRTQSRMHKACDAASKPIKRIFEGIRNIDIKN